MKASSTRIAGAKTAWAAGAKNAPAKVTSGGQACEAHKKSWGR